MIDMKDVVPNKSQPRQEFNQEKLQELANSIREGELLQPIIVRINGNNKYQIVCGERRFKAFQILKESKIPAIIRNIKDDTDALEKSLIENLQRDDLTSVERENAVGALWDSGRYDTGKNLAKKLGITKESVNSILRAREFRQKSSLSEIISTRTITDTETLPDESRKKILEQISDGKIKADNVRDIVRKVKEFPEPEQQMEILEEFEKKEQWGKEAFDEIIQHKKEIAEGKRHPEIIIGSDKYKNFIDEMENVFQATRNYGIANINDLPTIHKKRAIALITNSISYWIEQLKQIGGEEGVKELLEKAKVI